MRVAINGFGRIGRLALRAIIESGRKDLDVVAINDLGSAKFNAHLLQYDSVHGIFSKKVTGRKSSIGIGNKYIKIFCYYKIKLLLFLVQLYCLTKHIISNTVIPSLCVFCLFTSY